LTAIKAADAVTRMIKNNTAIRGTRCQASSPGRRENDCQGSMPRITARHESIRIPAELRPIY
jgi:hypothetical protein